MDTIAGILNAIQICRNANVLDTPAADEPPPELEHWIEVFADKKQIAPALMLACAPARFIMLMVYSIRYHPGEKVDPADVPPLIYAVRKLFEDSGELQPGSRIYPLCDIVLFEPSGKFKYKGEVYNFKQRAFYDKLAANSLPDAAEATDIVLADGNFISLCRESAAGRVCSQEDFKQIEDYFKTPGNILKYYNETASAIEPVQICH